MYQFQIMQVKMFTCATEFIYARVNSQIHIFSFCKHVLYIKAG